MNARPEVALTRLAMHVGMRELCGAPVSQDVFRRVLSRHAVEDWLQTLGKASRVIEALPPASGQLDRELAAHLGAHANRAAHVIDAGGRFVSQAAINTVAREALIFGAEGDPVGFDSRGYSDLAWALLGAIDLFEDRRPIGDLEAAEADAVLASLFLRRIARPYSHLRNRLPRTYRLFVDLPQRHPDLASGFDFDASCRHLSGVSLARYLATSFTFHARFGTATAPENWLLTYAYFRSVSSISETEFRGVIDTVSATPDELRSEYETEAAHGRSGIDDHRPLVRRPICEVRPGVFIPIDFEALGERLIGDGV